MKSQVFDSWPELKALVEARFGLTKSQLLDAFFSMRQSDTESASQFIMRVEDKRALYSVSED